MTYAAPLDDMRFVLEHLAGLPEIATLPGFEDAEPELVEAILTEAARFAAEVLAPLNATGDRQGCRWDGWKSHHAGRLSAAVPAIHRAPAGTGMPASPDIGGQGMPALALQRRRRDVEIRQPLLLALSDADNGRGAGAGTPCVRGAQAALSCRKWSPASGPGR